MGDISAEDDAEANRVAKGIALGCGESYGYASEILPKPKKEKNMTAAQIAEKVMENFNQATESISNEIRWQAAEELMSILEGVLMEKDESGGEPEPEHDIGGES